MVKSIEPAERRRFFEDNDEESDESGGGGEDDEEEDECGCRLEFDEAELVLSSKGNGGGVDSWNELLLLLR